MNNLKIILPAVAAAGSLMVWPGYAHGFGDRTELPVPLEYFLIGAGFAVAHRRWVGETTPAALGAVQMVCELAALLAIAASV